jgi:hypothetical protein
VDAIEHSGEERVRAALCEAGAPFRRPDGSYRLENLEYGVATPGSKANPANC